MPKEEVQALAATVLAPIVCSLPGHLRRGRFHPSPGSSETRPWSDAG